MQHSRGALVRLRRPALPIILKSFTTAQISIENQYCSIIESRQSDYNEQRFLQTYLPDYYITIYPNYHLP
ncbi:MAG: hypothetical protein ACKOW8_03580, partial [Flavobacteriales bacterium]